jgi:hypothetical protein
MAFNGGGGGRLAASMGDHRLAPAPLWEQQDSHNLPVKAAWGLVDSPKIKLPPLEVGCDFLHGMLAVAMCGSPS